jgi:formylglycine-generating enzyme required for sulfatase activity
LTNILMTGAMTNWVDSSAIGMAQRFYRTLAVTNPAFMALIPAGSFQMGDALDAELPAQPIHTVYVSGFYMDKNLVTKALWDDVYQWALAHGYSFDNAGMGKAATHPVQTLTWYDVTKWCNARSEKEGLTPAYYTNAAQKGVYRNDQIDLQNDWVKWSVGYRLPTEAEWEKAARGGLSEHRFPWGDTISHSEANYCNDITYVYDVSPTRGFHPLYNDGVFPYTSPVGSFAPNGYGLYDMAGNVFQWCWDGWDDYASQPATDPRGNPSNNGMDRLFRGGSWFNNAWYSRTSNREHIFSNYRFDVFGFRTVISFVQ